MPLTGIRIYAVSTVVSGEDVRLSAVRVSNYQLTVTEADGTTVHFVGIIRVAPRCEVVSRPCVTTTPSSQNKAFANIVATMLRGAYGQGVDDVYVDERGYIHIILEDGKDVSCELILPKYYTKEEVGELYATIESLSKKQDKISDLATIRSGAEKGTTAVQPSDIAKVAKSGSYADLSGKPTFKTVNGESVVGEGNIIIHPLQQSRSIAPGQSTVLVPSYNIVVDNPVVGLITINFPTPLSAAKQTRCSISFLTGASSLTINYGATIWWANGDSPSIEANTMYEMTFVWNAVANAWLGVYGKFKA